MFGRGFESRRFHLNNYGLKSLILGRNYFLFVTHTAVSILDSDFKY